MKQADVYSFLHSKIHAVISTCGKNLKPEAALIGFGETEKLEIIFGTFKTTRKYRNLLENTRVALVVGWDEDGCTVQYEGIATELSEEEVKDYLEIYHKKVPSAAHYAEHPDQTYFIVRPSWIRYTDVSGEVEQVEEFTF